MITRYDLEEAIAECQGQRNPNANTCMKLAAFYTIKQHMYPDEEQKEDIPRGYSYAGPDVVNYDGESDFAKTISGMETERVMAVMDEAMDAVSVLQPRLYDSILRKLRD